LWNAGYSVVRSTDGQSWTELESLKGSSPVAAFGPDPLDAIGSRHQVRPGCRWRRRARPGSIADLYITEPRWAETSESNSWRLSPAYGSERSVFRAPLHGFPTKSVLIQFVKGDESNPNPRNTAITRAVDLSDRVTFYRNDLAYAEDSTIRKDPHSSI